MNEIVKANKLLKKAVQDTYKNGKCTETECYIQFFQYRFNSYLRIM